MELSIVNSGVGLSSSSPTTTGNHGIGLANVSRLLLHYGERASLSITELDDKKVQVLIWMPLYLPPYPPDAITKCVTQ